MGFVLHDGFSGYGSRLLGGLYALSRSPRPPRRHVASIFGRGGQLGVCSSSHRGELHQSISIKPIYLAHMAQHLLLTWCSDRGCSTARRATIIPADAVAAAVGDGLGRIRAASCRRGDVAVYTVPDRDLAPSASLHTRLRLPSPHTNHIHTAPPPPRIAHSHGCVHLGRCVPPYEPPALRPLVLHLFLLGTYFRHYCSYYSSLYSLISIWLFHYF